MAKPFRPKAYKLKEKELRFAIDHTYSLVEAARFLNVSPTTFRKYANLYIDSETKMTLTELITSKERPKTVFSNNSSTVNPTDIYNGRHLSLPVKRVQEILIRENEFPEQCSICGFEERRITDYIVPLLLNFKDGNKKNRAKDNLEFLCYNCFFLYVGNVKGLSAPNLNHNHHDDV